MNDIPSVVPVSFVVFSMIPFLLALSPLQSRLAYGAPRLPRSTRRPSACIGSASSAMKALWLSKKILSLN